ncbi:MAG: hypothetical protein ABI556_11785, partial [Gemmatimonadales bacterium]
MQRTGSTFEEFESLARRNNAGAADRVVPVWREIVLDADTPVSAFAKLSRPPFGFLLESAPAGGETWARYTFMGTEPRSAWRLRGRLVDEWDPHHGWHTSRESDDPLADLDQLIASAQPVDVPELGAFWTGAVGYFGYDAVGLIERLPPVPPQSSTIPDALFVFTRSMVIIDNLRSRARIVVGVIVRTNSADSDLRQLHEEALEEVRVIEKRLSGHGVLAALALDPNAPVAKGRSSIARDDFIAGVERIKEY